ncbi:MAG: TetR/AcrR family transcriptional regulator [Microthrixaceae bacterium]
MSHDRWHPHSDEKLAVDDLLDAAGRAFAEVGVAHATMIDVARVAGCSRATLYRYFPNREALHLGFVHRATLRITAGLAEARDAGAPDSLTDRIMGGIAAVRSDPLLSVWFEPENMAVPIAVSQSSDLLQAMTEGIVGELDPESQEYEEIERRGEWLLRCIVSFLAMPAENEEVERAMIDSFLVPLLVSEPVLQGSHT